MYEATIEEFTIMFTVGMPMDESKASILAADLKHELQVSVATIAKKHGIGTKFNSLY